MSKFYPTNVLVTLVSIFLFIKGTIFFVPVNLAQLIRTMHNICKVRGSNPRHHQKGTTFFTSKKHGFKSTHLKIIKEIACLDACN